MSIFDEGRLTGTKEAGENINFGHNAVASFIFPKPPQGAVKQSEPQSAGSKNPYIPIITRLSMGNRLFS